jgi:hypothetical protein
MFLKTLARPVRKGGSFPGVLCSIEKSSPGVIGYCQVSDQHVHATLKNIRKMPESSQNLFSEEYSLPKNNR